jgi:thiol-disulfide isomerase/thioredoxin
MNPFKKIFHRPYLNTMVILLAIGFGIHYYNIDPLNISLDSPAHKLNDYIKPDKILIVSFWASWCPYCRNEIEILKQFKLQHPEIAILGLKVDEGDSGDILQNAGYPNLDASMHGAQIMQLFGNYTAALPFTLILKNHSSRTLLGETSPEKLEQNVSAIQKGR